MEIRLSVSIWRHAFKVLKIILDQLFLSYHYLSYATSFIHCFRENVPDSRPDACRIHGQLTLTKVAGNFHVTAGKVLPLPMRAHAHISPMIDDDRFNYSHRIQQFSFGPRLRGLVQPLEGDENIANQGLGCSQELVL